MIIHVLAVRRMLLSSIIGIFSFILILFFVIFSESCVPETRNAVMMFLNTVLPTMFPFYVLSSLIVSGGFLTRIAKPVKPLTERVMRLPGSCIAAIILGCLCGFPIGAKITCDLKARGDITEEEAERLSSFTNNVGPVFMDSIVGGTYLGSIRSGLLIWLSVTLASLGSGILLCRVHRSSAAPGFGGTPPIQGKTDIPAAILSSLNTVLYVGAVIIFFSSVTSLLKLIPCLSDFIYSASYSFLEITGGLRSLGESVQAANPILKYMLFSAFSAWSGCSVHMQVCGILASGNIKVKYYFIGKLLQSLLAPLIAAALFFFL